MWPVMKNNITQLISPWANGERSVIQFFPELREMWEVRLDNSGKVISRSVRELGAQFDTVKGETLSLAVALGWERHEMSTAEGGA